MFELHATEHDQTDRMDAASSFTTVGLAGVIADRGRRAWRARVPGGAAVEGFRWGLFDTFTPTWWPQGVSAGEFEGTPLVITSWYAQPKRGVEMGARISVVDLTDPLRPRYHHVLLVAARRTDAGVTFEPVVVHAGGIVWSGDRLLVAATRGGILEFRLSDIVRAPSAGLLGRSTGPFGYRYLLPQLGEFAPPRRTKSGLRFSFLAEEAGEGADELRLVSGEFTTSDSGRLSRFALADAATAIDDIHVPGIEQMQGVVRQGGTWFVNASRGDKLGGDLWVGTPGAMVRHEHVLPPGPEDLALWPQRGQLWSVTEFPGKRWVYAVDAAAWVLRMPPTA